MVRPLRASRPGLRLPEPGQFRVSDAGVYLGPELSENIDWSGPRLLCIAGDFTRYDEYAVLQIPRNIELLRHRRYGGDLLLLEIVPASTTVPNRRRAHASEAAQEKELVAGT